MYTALISVYFTYIINIINLPSLTNISNNNSYSNGWFSLTEKT